MLIQFIKLYKVLSDIIKSGNNPFDVDYWTPMYFHPYTTYVEGEWTPFSWEDYKKFCTHGASDIERNVLDAFVNGGKPVLRTSATLTPGWLDYTYTNRVV